MIVCIEYSESSGSLSISTSAGHGSDFLRARVTPRRVSASRMQAHAGRTVNDGLMFDVQPRSKKFEQAKTTSVNIRPSEVVADENRSETL